MSEQPSHSNDEISESGVRLLVRSLQTDAATTGVSPRNHAHRSRVIRQQTDLLAQKLARDAADKRDKANRRKASRAPDHREEGGQG